MKYILLDGKALALSFFGDVVLAVLANDGGLLFPRNTCPHYPVKKEKQSWQA